MPINRGRYSEVYRQIAQAPGNLDEAVQVVLADMQAHIGQRQSRRIYPGARPH